MNIFLASPRGFCAGVERAIDIVYKSIECFPKKRIFVFHEIVHNNRVLEDFKKLGVTFTENVEDVTDDSVLIFSAHGVSDAVENSAKLSNAKIIDASCPLVKKVHYEAQKLEEMGYTIILIGHKNHPEVLGTIGKLYSKVFLISNVSDVKNLILECEKISYITQTTLSVDDTKEIIDALKIKFPHIKGPDLKDICYATQNRQNALKELMKVSDVIFVIGSKNSSNSNSLCKVAESGGIPVYLIDSYLDIKPDFLECKQNLGITAGASTPEVLINEILGFLKSHYSICKVSNIETVKENVLFRFPKELVG